MATEAVVSLLIQRLNYWLEEEDQSMAARHEAGNIRDELQRMSEFIRSADAIVVLVAESERDQQQAIRDWLQQVREVAFSLEGVIDDFELRLLLQDSYHRHRMPRVFVDIVRCLPSPRRMPFHPALLTQMKDIRQRVLQLSNKRPRGSSSYPASTHGNDRPQRRTRIIPSSVGEANDPIGTELARDLLVQWLLEEEPRLTPVSLVGMGGLGKTTLARQVYNTRSIGKRFDCRAWITVSRRFRIDSVLLSLIEQFRVASNRAGWRTHMELSRTVADFLRDKRYLIVLDDVWSLDVWDSVRYALPDSQRGSRVMITTRKAEIAMSTYGQIYSLRLLSPEAASQLFNNKAFPPGTACPRELEETAAGIVRRCGGLPLMTALAGGLLSLKQGNEWHKFLESFSGELESNPHSTNLTRLIRLSFNDLPHYLKSCLLYFCMFPEDAAVRGTRLIRLWTAEGFIQAEQRKTEQEVADDCLGDLIHRSMVQASELHDCGRLRNCQVHGLIRDQILAVAREEDFALNFRYREIRLHERVRRLSIQNNLEQDANFARLRNLQSLFVFGEKSFVESSVQTVISSNRVMKVLDLGGVPLKTFPNGVEKLLLLKYLGLRRSQIAELPRSVGNLVNLETLDLKYCSQISTLPKEILDLKRLRHLLVSHHSAGGASVPKGIGSLTSLESLGCINIGPEESVGELGNLINLGKLCIANLSGEHGRILLGSIPKMVRLRSLKVYTQKDQSLDFQAIASPPTTLQRLHLTGRLESLPGWFSSLANLVKMSLSESRLTDRPLEILKSLPKLAVLIFNRAYDGKELGCRGGGFPSLRLLKLADMDGLEAVNLDKGAFPCLKELQIWCCPNLKNIPDYIKPLVSITLEETKRQQHREEEEDDANLPIHREYSLHEEAEQHNRTSNEVTVTHSAVGMAAWADGVNNDVSNVNLIRNKEESTWKNLSIYRVPEYMVHDASRAMYRPQVVSIGPYHHGEAHLKPMEESKRRALVHMLAAAGDTRRRDVRRYMGQLKRLLRDLMSCYEQLDPRWEEENGENFLQVMLLDGVFLLEVLRRNHSMYAPSDPIFSEQRQPSIIEYIKRDMLMLENQLPFLVLEKLAAVFTGDSPAAVNQHLNRLLFKFFFPNREPTYMGPGKHILDVLRQSMIQSPEQSILKTPSVVQQLTIASPGSSPNWLVMAPTQALNLLARCMGYKSPAPVLPLSADNFRVPTFSSSRSATALCHAGIDFKGKESGGIRDIVFDEGKLQLRLPTITIDHIAEATFLNFILFEQLHLKEGRLVSSYFLFMGSIVTTPEDVAILEEKKIIECSGVCNHTVVEIIKNLTRGLSFHRKDALYQIHRQLNDYYGVSEKMCRRRVDRWHMKLCDTYFESPWSIIKLIAGVVILSATVIATCYSALSFYRPGLPVGTPRSSQP